MKLIKYLFLVTVLFVFCLPMFAGSTATQKKATTGKSGSFSQSPFPGRVEPGYLGNDAQALFQVLATRLKSQKTEFETTQEYQARLTKQLAQPLYGTITRESALAFVFSDSVSSAMFVRYDADEQRLHIQLNVFGAHTGFDEYAHDKLALLWNTLETSPHTYVGSNAFGASVEVRSTHTTNLGLAFDESSARFISRVVDEINIGTYTHKYTHDAVAFDLIVPPTTAKDLKRNVRVLVIGRLSDPYILEGETYHAPTITEPHSDSDDYRYIHLKVDRTRQANHTVDGCELLRAITRSDFVSRPRPWA